MKVKSRRQSKSRSRCVFEREGVWGDRGKKKREREREREREITCLHACLLFAVTCMGVV